MNRLKAFKQFFACLVVAFLLWLAQGADKNTKDKIIPHADPNAVPILPPDTLPKLFVQ